MQDKGLLHNMQIRMRDSAHVARMSINPSFDVFICSAHTFFRVIIFYLPILSDARSQMLFSASLMMFHEVRRSIYIHGKLLY